MRKTVKNVVRRSLRSSATRRRVRRAAVAGACLAAVAMAPSAVATPGHGVTAETLAEGTHEGRLLIRNVGATDTVVRRIVIEPGGTTGWHYHEGQVLATVVSGTLTRTLHDCSQVVHGPGDSLVEPAGHHHVHSGSNLGTEPVVLYATYFVPDGKPLVVDAENPGCDA
jgi:quercetin dioxygenase-like cupin family protein